MIFALSACGKDEDSKNNSNTESVASDTEGEDESKSDDSDGINIADMSYDDAKKYNNYWDEIENGTHNPPEMDNIDMKAWDTADAKLNENYIKNNLENRA